MEVLDTISKLLTIATIVGGLLYALYRWIFKQDKQTEDIEANDKHIDEVEQECEKHIEEVERECLGKIDALKSETKESLNSIQKEQALIVYGLLSALKGLQEKGCNGPVTEAIDKLERHINIEAHKNR